MNKAARYSFRYQVIILFFIVVAIPFVFIGYFAYNKSVETVELANSTVSLDAVGRTGKNLDAYLNEVNDKQDEIMYSKEVQAALSSEPKDRLEEINLSTELIRLSNLKNSASNALMTVRIFPWETWRYSGYLNAIYPGVDIEEQAWFQSAKERGKPFWHLFLPRDNPTKFKEPSLARVKRLYSLERTEPRGIVTVEVKESVLRDYLSPLMMVEGQRIMLVHPDNTVYYHSASTGVGEAVPYSKLSEFMKLGNSGSKTIELDGSRYIVTYTKLEHTAFKLVSLIPLEQLTKPVEGIESMTMLFLLFYFLLSLFTIIYLTVRFSNPIHEIVMHMKRVERGDFNVHWQQLPRKDEVGLLYHGMTHMVRQLGELVDNLGRAAQEKKELEFQVLTHQINPHFLYNTLDVIRWKAEKRNAKDISDMVTSLADLFRLSLNDGKEMTTVARELDHVRAYVAMQQERQDTPIQLVIVVDDDLLELPLLRLLLQPLVENSIKHGERSRREEEIKIVITGSIEHGVVRFEIRDNGPGIAADVRRRLLAGTMPDGAAGQRQGVGLRNVHERLRVYFGEPYGLRILDHSGGAVIEITHPIMRNEAGAQ